MTLAAVESEVEGLRSSAKNAQDSYDRLVKQINNDHALSDAGKTEQRNAAFAETREYLRGLRAKEESLIDDEIVTLRVRIESRSGSGSTDIIAFRDAQDRADRLENADEALPLIERALRQRDTSLAAAVFRRAIDSGWRSVIDAYTAAHPEAADIIGELNYLTRAKEDSWQRTMTYAIFAR